MVSYLFICFVWWLFHLKRFYDAMTQKRNFPRLSSIYTATRAKSETKNFDSAENFVIIDSMENIRVRILIFAWNISSALS